MDNPKIAGRLVSYEVALCIRQRCRECHGTGGVVVPDGPCLLCSLCQGKGYIQKWVDRRELDDLEAVECEK